MPDLHPFTNPRAFKEARHKLGLSAQKMADALGVKAGRTIRRWEAGQNDIPLLAAREIERMLQEQERTTDHGRS